MGKKSPKAPAAPDPVQTAAAQTASNKETAYWNAALNNVNQITPYGNLTYKQTGGGKTYNDAAFQQALTNYSNNANAASQKYTIDATGKQILNKNYNPNFSQNVKAPNRESYLLSDTPPQFESKIDLSPEQQQLLETSQRSDNALATLGEQQIGRITNAVSTPYSYSGLGNEFSSDDAMAQQQRAEEALMSRMNPQFARDEEALRTRLINQGIGQNSEAYKNEMNQFSQAKNDARLQSVLQGQQYGGVAQQQALQRRNQGIQEYNAQRNAPLNEYTALTSGQQVQNPQFQSNNYQGAGQVDYAGLVNNQYQGQLANYNAKVAGNNSMMSGLFGLGASLGGSFLGSKAGSKAVASLFSDERLKENIEDAGIENGHKVYKFNYKGDDKQYVGVMAQDVLEKNPDAVVYDDSGFMKVNYTKIGVNFREVA